MNCSYNMSLIYGFRKISSCPNSLFQQKIHQVKNFSVTTESLYTICIFWVNYSFYLRKVHFVFSLDSCVPFMSPPILLLSAPRSLSAPSSLVTVSMQQGVGRAYEGFSLIGTEVGIFDPGSHLTATTKFSGFCLAHTSKPVNYISVAFIPWSWP